MKTSKIFNLQKTQYELDFVDIDPGVDTPLFLDPYYISKCDFPFAIEVHSTLRSYLDILLALLRGKRLQQVNIATDERQRSGKSQPAFREN